MSDKKISQLASATTPLAGSEILPIVQSGTTKKIAADDLTVKNFRSNATTGIVQVTGPTAGSTRIMTVPDSNFTAARIDSAQSFTGDQTLSTGNLVIGTSGKGIDFGVTSQAGGMTSELLNDYEEGTWTPTDASGAGLTFSNVDAYYTKIGRMVYAYCRITYPTTANANSAVIGGLPYNVQNTQGARQGSITYTSSTANRIFPIPNTAQAVFFIGTTAATNAQMSGTDNWLMIAYPTP